MKKETVEWRCDMDSYYFIYEGKCYKASSLAVLRKKAMKLKVDLRQGFNL